ncbi:MAG: hypothetical protein ACXVGE_12995 [Blastococcus sp.]
MASSASSVRSRAASPRLLGSETPRLFTPPLRKLTPRTSAGFALIEFASEVLGMELLPWQKWLAIHALELLPDNTFRFRTVVLLVARQNGKSTFLQVLALFFMYVRGVSLVIGTAQNLDIAEEVWQGAVDIAQEVPELAAEIERVSMVNGKKALELRQGERYKVQAASRRGGRGLSGDLVLLDELREHQNWEAWGAVTKTTLARVLAQIWAASNAGDGASVVLHSLRSNALKVIDGEQGEDYDDSLGLFEWSAPDGCDLADPRAIAAANPSLGHTITLRAILSALATDPETVYRTECLCQWVDRLVPAVIDAQVWANLAAEVPRGDSVTFSLEVARARGSAVIGCSWPTPTGTHVEVAETDAGTGWVVDWLTRNSAAFNGHTVILDGGTEAASFIPALEAAGLAVVKLTGPQRAEACGLLFDAAQQGSLTHDGDLALADAVGAATWKDVGDGARAFSRRSSKGDISRLYAVTLAHYGLKTAPNADVLQSIW